ncbi:PREDICTED: histone deacetylase HDT1-like isoform X1 [Nicotiana attenuata]|uniref:histone deacetylase HDT1-like isoform X1 n=1 Tax=Nicotiana attenuata TaxID=49451 RepID=UPI0009046920|nr:PREDICTED: histone deacetylase HDT1-like isoform X1 [Nicotiana attenuata]
MEFWGAEVKSGQPLTVQPGDGMVLHLSQASLGEAKKDKGSEPVCLSVNVDGKKLVLGTLNLDKLPQQQFDLVFDKDFELSHNWKNGSVYFFGYKAANPYEQEEDEEDEDESDEEIPLTLANIGKAEAKASANDSTSGKQKVKIAEPSKDAKADDEDDSSDEDDTSGDEEDSEMGEDEDDSDEDKSDEETPKKAEPSKKRPADSATKTSALDKKAKFATPQKADGKKGAVHVATPHPSKQAGKTPGNKSNQTPKSGGSLACKTCNRTFGSETALESHSKAKHSAGK